MRPFLVIYIPNRFVQQKYEPPLRGHSWSTVVCYVAVIAQLFRLSTHPKATELRVTALASLDRHLRRLARADVALLPAGVQHGGGKGARCTAAWLLP